jgi:hypothetical protein
VTIRPVPGPWRVPGPFRPRYVDPAADEVTYTATCDRCGGDATWRKGKDATKPTCTCTCSPVEGAA